MLENIRLKNNPNKQNFQNFRLAIYGQKQIIGMKEIIRNIDHRTTTVTCYSSEAEVYFINAEIFLRNIETFGIKRKVEEDLENQKL